MIGTFEPVHGVIGQQDLSSDVILTKDSPSKRIDTTDTIGERGRVLSVLSFDGGCGSYGIAMDTFVLDEYLNEELRLEDDSSGMDLGLTGSGLYMHPQIEGYELIDHKKTCSICKEEKSDSYYSPSDWKEGEGRRLCLLSLLEGNDQAVFDVQATKEGVDSQGSHLLGMSGRRQEAMRGGQEQFRSNPRGPEAFCSCCSHCREAGQQETEAADR